MNFLKKIFSTIAKASKPKFVVDSNNLNFLLDSNEYFSYEIDNYNSRTRHSPYVSEAYTLSNNEIFIEAVKLQIDASWNGHARSVYEGFFKEELKINKMEILKRDEFGSYEFTTYKINDSFIIHLIYIWSAKKNIFIFDAKGKLFTALLKELNKDYEYKYDSLEKGEINFDISIVKVNSFKSYFGMDK